jgi:hypothetical protein
MAVPDNSERRKHSRVGFTTDILICIEADGRSVELETSSKDLSLKGIFVSSEEKFSEGTKCDVKVFLSGSIENIELAMKGTVMRISKNGMGIEFDSMGVNTYSHLKKIVQYNRADDSV